MAIVKKKTPLFEAEPEEVKFLVDVNKDLFTQAKKKKTRERLKWKKIIEFGLRCYLDTPVKR